MIKENKMRFLFLLNCLLSCGFLYAQEVFSIVSHPGEDAAKETRVSWGAQDKGTFVLVSLKKDTLFNKGKTVEPEAEGLCTTYDSIPSKTPQGVTFYEYPHFIKCGASLKNLKPDTEYVYRICKSEGGKVKPLSSLHYFKTAGAKEWSATIISDYHSYTPLGHRLRDAMLMVDCAVKYDPSVDWILQLGDVAAWGGSYSFWKRMYEEVNFKRFAWAGLNGNHDNMTMKYGQSNYFFRDANYAPLNGYGNQVGVCYHFRYHNALFIMLNNEAMKTDAELQSAQEWVRKVVTAARKQKNAPRYVIVCEHYQWFYGESGKVSQYARWSNLFDELGVDLALAGNNHIYARTNAIYQGKCTDGKRGTVYLQTASSDNERGRSLGELVENTDLIKKVWAEGPKTVSALNMKVTNKNIQLTLLDRNGNEIDKVLVLSKKH